MTAAICVELHFENCYICNPDGSELQDETLQDVLDCTASGDCEDACNYVRDAYSIDWRILKMEEGEYRNLKATAEDKAALCREIYFDSDADFDYEDIAETYLIWDAAHNIDH